MPSDDPSAIQRILTASDPWQALGLARGVDEAAVKTACCKLSLEVHPDKNPELHQSIVSYCERAEEENGILIN